MKNRIVDIYQDKEGQHEGELLIKLMNIYWGTRVTQLARVSSDSMLLINYFFPGILQPLTSASMT